MRQFLIAVLVIWMAACAAAYLYSQQQNIPPALLIAVLPALLLELAFYLLPGFGKAREYLERVSPEWLRALLLLISAIVPYMWASVATHTFGAVAFLLLTSVAGVAVFWYVFLPASLPGDLLFLTFMAGVLISKVFPSIYVRPLHTLPLDQLGRLMWIRLGITVVLSIRGLEDIRFGFLPSSAEWRIGIEQYLYLLPVVGGVSYVLRAMTFHLAAATLWKLALDGALTFLGVLWVLAAGEEFFFRGVLQTILTRNLRSPVAALILTSVLFGLVHLPFRHFPNWRFSSLAALAGLFYGTAYIRAKSIRAAMVTHALTVTTWRLFFY